jgi:hypothetical protein
MRGPGIRTGLQRVFLDRSFKKISGERAWLGQYGRMFTKSTC